MRPELDEIDVQLLALLQQDADRTNLELSREVGLSAAATLHRVRRLKETGVIRTIAARLDPAAIGLPLQMYISVTMVRNDSLASRGFLETVRETPQIISADWVAGETDAMLFVVARDVAELQVVLTRLATRGAQRLTTWLCLEEIKPASPLPLPPGRAAGRRTVTPQGSAPTPT